MTLLSQHSPPVTGLLPVHILPQAVLKTALPQPDDAVWKDEDALHWGSAWRRDQSHQLLQPHRGCLVWLQLQRATTSAVCRHSAQTEAGGEGGPHLQHWRAFRWERTGVVDDLQVRENMCCWSSGERGLKVRENRCCCWSSGERGLQVRENRCCCWSSGERGLQVRENRCCCWSLGERGLKVRTGVAVDLQVREVLRWERTGVVVDLQVREVFRWERTGVVVDFQVRENRCCCCPSGERGLMVRDNRCFCWSSGEREQVLLLIFRWERSYGER